MTLLAFSIFVSVDAEVNHALERAARGADAGADMIEWRVDLLAEDPDADRIIPLLLDRCPLPCIVTCRPHWEGGSFAGEESSRISMFESLAVSHPQPKYIDLELSALERSMNLRQKVLLAVRHEQQAREIDTSLILSRHDFERRPRDLWQCIERMARDEACAIIKLAWHARSLRDNLEAFDVLAERTKPTICLCMGEFGLMSRVLAPKFGGFLTFATDVSGSETAPGQPTLHDLKRLYRFDAIRSDTKVYGVIGWPVKHSQSPQIHNAVFTQSEHNGVYLPLPIPPEWEHFKATVGEFIDHPRLDFAGASVTIPHKQHLLRYIREVNGRVDPLAERIGAANTLTIDADGTPGCTNTDAPAAIASLCNAMKIEPEALKQRTTAVLGAGGVARAVVAGLLEHSARVVVFNRSAERAEQLAADLGRDANGVIEVGAEGALASCGAEVIINCTALGMAGGPDAEADPISVFEDGQPIDLDASVTVMDTVYTPTMTPMLKRAEAAGATIITGEDMFLRQAALQSEMWTGAPAPMDVMREALNVD